MLLCPVQNSSFMIGGQWLQSRPRITQKFGERPLVYKQFGLKGHNGVDIGIPTGTPVFAPFDGEVQITDSGKEGYGLHIKIRSKEKAMECVLGHLSEVRVVQGQMVRFGDKIALSGNTGFSTAPHLHTGYRMLKPSKAKLWNWEVLDYNNGYKGYFDHLELEITWKGTHTKPNL